MSLPDKTTAPSSQPIQLPDMPEPPTELRRVPGFTIWENAMRAWWKRVRETLQRELNN